MKKILLMCLGIFLTASVSFAQGEFRLGLKLTPLVSTVRMTDNERIELTDLDKGGKAGLNTGLMVNYLFSDKAGIYSGVQIVMKGYSYETTADTSILSKTNLTFVEIPLALSMRTNELTPGVRIRGLFGLTANVAVAGKTEVNGVIKRSTADYSLITPDFLMGLGSEISLGNAGTLDAGFSYHHALSKISSTIGTQTGIVKLNYIALDLGFYF